jgi:hypothetical protein
MITGHCECGAVQYQVAGEINDFSHCHCSQCRRLHGAAYATFAGVHRDKFSYLSGESSVKSYASSDSHARLFCGTCGSNICVELSEEPGEIYIAMGTIDGDPPRPSAYHIFVGSKAPWHEITDQSPQYDEEPPEE